MKPNIPSCRYSRADERGGPATNHTVRVAGSAAQASGHHARQRRGQVFATVLDLVDAELHICIALFAGNYWPREERAGRRRVCLVHCVLRHAFLCVCVHVLLLVIQAWTLYICSSIIYLLLLGK